MMAHKKTHGAPIPPGNAPKSGPKTSGGKPAVGEGEVDSAQEQDTKHRQGDYEGRAEHSIQEPGGKNGADH